MAYSAEVSRSQPACIYLVVDQSSSMSRTFPESETPLAVGVANVVNQTIRTLVIECTKSMNTVSDYFQVGVLGYGSGASPGPAFSGSLKGREMVGISELAHNPARQVQVEDEDGLVSKEPIWVEPVTGTGTPMKAALRRASKTLMTWTQEHPDAYPPLVFHVTDGESTDGDPRDEASRIRSVSTSDGSALLFNIHLSSRSAEQVQFPDSASGLPDAFAERLFEMSSPLPPPYREMLREYDRPVSERTRGFAYNADLTVLTRVIEIGTRGPTRGGLLN